MVNASYFLPRSVKSIGLWGYKKLSSKYQNICESVENIVHKVTSKPQVLLNETLSQNVCESTALPKKNVQHFWKPGFNNYKTTLKENAMKAQKQLLYNDMRGRSFFSKDFMWRRARKGHLMAFAGLFLYQEDVQDKLLGAKKQYDIYNRICSDLQSLFPIEEPEQSIIPEDHGNKLDDYLLNLPVSVDASGTVFDATLLSKKTQPESVQSDSTCSEFDFCDSVFDEPHNCLQEISVKVMHPVPRYESPLSILNYHDSELACCGRGSYTFHNGNQPKKKYLPPHDNIIRFEKVFFGCMENDDQSGRFSFTQHEDRLSALFAVTKRYDTSLGSYMNKRKLDVDTIPIIFIQLLEALAHLEEHHFIHRDVTPNNIMLDLGDNEDIPHVVLSGFGNSFGGSKSEVLVPFEDETLDTRVGKRSAIPPEISRAKPQLGGRVDYTKCDVWMAGVLLHQLLTGKTPFGVDALDSRFYKDSDLPELDDVVATQTLKVLAQSMLSVDPAKRPTAREAADILHFEIFATAPEASLGDATLLSTLCSWAVSHCAEAIMRKNESQVLYKVCENFFRKMNPARMMAAADMWMAIN